MKKYLFSGLFSFFSYTVFCQSISLTEIAGPFPWMIGFEMPADDDRFFTIRQDGFIVIVEPASPNISTIFLDLSTKINLEGEQGLLGFAFHPDYKDNGFFYVYYNAVNTKKSTISRFSRDSNNADLADPNSEQILLTFDQPTIKHNGGCLQFGLDGYLYISSGDGGGLNDPQNNGQKTNTFLGKLLRIDVNNGSPYAIPADNPFDQMFGYYPEIWATGLRNPWRFSFDRLTGDLWIADVGQEEWEEVMFQPANDAGGQNYGWSCREGSIDFNDFGCWNPDEFVNPTFQYPHDDNGDCSGSVTGGFVYRGMQNGNLFGKYIFTDFCTGNFTALTRNGNEIIEENLGTFNAFDYISFSENNFGELFVNSYFSGHIFKLESVDCAPVAEILPPVQTIGCVGDTLILEAYFTGDSSFIFQWQRNGNNISNANNTDVKISQMGDYQLVVTNLQNGCTAISSPVGIGFSSISPTTVFEEICEGDSLVFNDETFWEAGFYEFELQTQNGCDSLVFLDLQMLPEVAETLNLDVETDFIFEGILIESDTTILQNLTAENGCDSLVTINFWVQIVGLNNAEISPAFHLYPNPVSTDFYLQKTGIDWTNSNVEIYNTFGKNVTHQFSFDKQKTHFKRENVPAGVYFMILKNGKEQMNLKFVCF